jgi:hypothetical protein
MERRMTPDERNDDLRRLWKSQPDEGPGVSLDIVRARSRMLERRVRRRNYVEYAAALVVVAFVAPLTWTAPNGVLLAGGLTLLAGIAYVGYRIHSAGSPRLMPADMGVLSSIDFHRAELERQRDLLQNIWTWYLLPFWPGLGLMMIGATIERPDHWPSALGSAVLAVLMGFQIAWMNKRSARTLQEMIDRFDENPVATLRSDPPSLTLAQRLSVWAVMSFLGATALLFVMQVFFPEAKASIIDFAGLPAATPNAVFILVLLAVGVAAQAAWWMIRRH